MDVQQPQMPIKWGRIIVFLILFFPVGFYFLFDEFKKKRTPLQYGKMLQTTGLIIFGLAAMTCIAMAANPLIYEDGTVATAGQKAGSITSVALFYTVIAAAFFFAGKRKTAETAKYRAYEMIEREQMNKADLEAEHPKITATCASCGAALNIRRGMSAVCEYCGSDNTA